MAKKSLKRIPKDMSYGAEKERRKRVRDHLTPFQDENSSVGQSWFRALVEWYAEVVLPNLQEANEAVELVRREFWMIDETDEIKDKGLRRLADEALNLFEQLEEQHALLDRQQEAFEIVERSSFEVSENIECINGDLMSLLERLRNR